MTDGIPTSVRERTVHVGDCVEIMSDWPSGWLDVAMFSPPYYRQKDYGNDGQMGLEDTPDEYLESLSNILGAVRRLLKPSGQVYLNIGDRYERKSRMLLPERAAVRLRDEGWCVRQVITWEKTNPLPENATDRRSTVTENVYHLTKNRQYFWDHEEAKVPAKIGGDIGIKRNPTNVVRTSTADYSGEHTAAYPLELCEAFLPQACPERVCAECGEPFVPQIGSETVEGVRDRTTERDESYDPTEWNHNRSSWVGTPKRTWKEGWEPSCSCGEGYAPGVVLDPMCGTGTTLLAAEQLGRRWVGIEIDPQIAEEAMGRLPTDCYLHTESER